MQAMTIAAVTQGRLEPFQGLFLRLQRTLRTGACRLHSVHATGLFPVMAINLLLLAQAHSGLVSRAQSLQHQLLPIIMVCSAFFPKLHPALAPSICQHQDCSCHCSSPASQKLGSKLRGRIYNGLASFCQLWHSFAQHGEVSEP